MLPYSLSLESGKLYQHLQAFKDVFGSDTEGRACSELSKMALRGSPPLDLPSYSSWSMCGFLLNCLRGQLFLNDLWGRRHS